MKELHWNHPDGPAEVLQAAQPYVTERYYDELEQFFEGSGQEVYWSSSPSMSALWKPRCARRPSAPTSPSPPMRYWCGWKVCRGERHTTSKPQPGRPALGVLDGAGGSHRGVLAGGRLAPARLTRARLAHEEQLANTGPDGPSAGCYVVVGIRNKWPINSHVSLFANTLLCVCAGQSHFR